MASFQASQAAQIVQAPPSPPQELTLCPITGKVLGQAEGEPTPSPSPEPELKKNDEEMEMQSILMSEDGQIQQLMTNEDGSPMIVTGEDGTIYQVAGKNEQGQTVLIAQGQDGEQQCVFVAAEDGEDGMLTLDNAVAEAVDTMAPEPQVRPSYNINMINMY